MTREDEDRITEELAKRSRRWESAYAVYSIAAMIIGAVVYTIFDIYREWWIWNR